MIPLRLYAHTVEHHETTVYTAYYSLGRFRYVAQMEVEPPTRLQLVLDPDQATYSVLNEDGTAFYCLGDSLFTVSEEQQAKYPPLYYAEGEDELA
jgi:hypothetical protein